MRKRCQKHKITTKKLEQTNPTRTILFQSLSIAIKCDLKNLVLEKLNHILATTTVKTAVFPTA